MTAVRILLAAAVLGLFLSTPALPRAAAAGPLVARNNYWEGFVDYWASGIKRQHGVVLVALGVGAVSLFIITRGKWRK